MSKKPNENLKNYVKFSALALQIGVIIYAFTWVGKKIDIHYHLSKPFGAVGMAALGMVLAIYLLIVTLKKMDNND